MEAGVGGGGGGRIIIFSFRGAQNLTPGAQWDQSDEDYTNFTTKEKQTEISREVKIGKNTKYDDVGLLVVEERRWWIIHNGGGVEMADWNGSRAGWC